MHQVSGCPPEEGIAYFSEVLIDVKLVFSVVPRVFTAAIMASEIPAAIRPYSIAVAPDSSFQNFKNVMRKAASVFDKMNTPAFRRAPAHAPAELRDTL
jgi:hypothetical protein